MREQGDGYKSTAVRIPEFIAWNILAKRPLEPSAMKGIVLIHEIERHPHPRSSVMSSPFERALSRDSAGPFSGPMDLARRWMTLFKAIGQNVLPPPEP